MRAGMARHSHETFFERLKAFDDFYEPVHRESVAWLNPGTGAHVADIGCGAGGMVCLFAQAVGEMGSVAAVEVYDDRLEKVQGLLAGIPHPNRVTLHRGKLPNLPFES